MDSLYLVPKYCLRTDIRGCSDYVNDDRESVLGTQLFCDGSSIIVRNSVICVPNRMFTRIRSDLTKNVIFHLSFVLTFWIR